jgi:RNA polymerase sigma factor (sigma-70 family)
MPLFADFSPGFGFPAPAAWPDEGRGYGASGSLTRYGSTVVGRVITVGQAFPGVLAAARGGEEWAWRAIYEEFAPQVRGYLRGRGETEPDDLVGEVFLQVVRALPGFEGAEADLRAWVLTIAHHRLIDEHRRQARRPSESAAPAGSEDGRPGGNVEEEALEALEEERMREILAELSPDQRSVLLLRVIADLTVEQVAKVLGKTRGAVKQLQRRGLMALKKRVSKLPVTM